MMKIDLTLWKQFETSGKIDDYIAYKIISNDFEEEQGNAFYDTGNSNS